MKKMNKKLWSLFLAGVMAVSLLAVPAMADDASDAAVVAFNADGGFENGKSNWTYGSGFKNDQDLSSTVGHVSVISYKDESCPADLTAGITGTRALKIESPRATTNYQVTLRLNNQQPGTLYKLTGRFYIYNPNPETNTVTANLGAAYYTSATAMSWQSYDDVLNTNGSGDYTGVEYYNKWVTTERYFITDNSNNRDFVTIALRAEAPGLRDDDSTNDGNYVVWDDIKLEKVENDVLFNAVETEMTAGNSYKGKVLMGNIIAESKTYVGFKALYEKIDDNSTRLISVEKFDINVPALTERVKDTFNSRAGSYRHDFEFDLTNTEVYSADKDYMAKVMIWDSLTRMQPISIGELD